MSPILIPFSDKPLSLNMPRAVFLTILLFTDFLQSEPTHTCPGCADPSCSNEIPGCTTDGLYSGVYKKQYDCISYTILRIVGAL